MVRSVSHAQQNPRAVRQGEHAAARKRYIQFLLRPYFRTSAAGLRRARPAAHKIREPTAAVLPICNAKSRGTDAFRAWCPAARLVRAVIYPYFSNSYDVLKALFMKALILRRQSAAGLRSVFFSIEVVVPDEAVKDELNRSLADAQGIASGIRFVTTQAWLDRMNHGSPDVSGRARALEWGIYAVVTDQAFLARPECSRLKK